jgi:hypothetical protein
LRNPGRRISLREPAFDGSDDLHDHEVTRVGLLIPRWLANSQS